MSEDAVLKEKPGQKWRKRNTRSGKRKILMRQCDIWHPLSHLCGHHMDDVFRPNAASLVKLIDFWYDTCMDTKRIMQDSSQ